MFDKMLNKIEKYNNIQDGLKDIEKTYNRGLLTDREKNDLISMLNLHYIIKKYNK